MTAIILAGGESRRMGVDKAFLKVEGAPLIKRQLKLLKRFFKKIILVTNAPSKYRLNKVKVVQDILPGCGPLGGIYAGLLASGTLYNFVLACDMPFINASLIKYMRQQARGFDAAIPKLNNRYEPLFAIYSKNCLEDIKTLLDKKTFQIKRLFPRLKIREIKKPEVLRFGSPGKIFMNINTPQDLVKVKHEAHLYSASR